MKKTERYTYKVTWSPEDNEHVGLCVEFPSLSWLASSAGAALKGIQKVVSVVIKDMKASGEEIPEPLATKSYSGKLVVRIPPECHKRLSMKAAESHISLNRLISDKLA